MAVRLCPCGAPLPEVGRRYRCPRCASPCAVWLVASSTGTVAVASEAAIELGSGLQTWLRRLGCALE